MNRLVNQDGGPYYLIDAQKKCCRRAVDQPDDALLTDDLLCDEIIRLRLFQGGADYDLQELYQEGLRHGRSGDAVASNACAKRLVAKRRYRDQLIHLITNAQLLQERLRETAQYDALTMVMRQSKVSLDQLLQRLQSADVDTLMDHLRDQSLHVNEIQNMLAEPIAPAITMSDSDSDVDLPDCPAHAVVVTERGRAAAIAAE